MFLLFLFRVLEVIWFNKIHVKAKRNHRKIFWGTKRQTDWSQLNCCETDEKICWVATLIWPNSKETGSTQVDILLLLN